MAKKRRREPRITLVSNPTPERMAKAGDTYETGGDMGSAIILRFQDDGLGHALWHKVIDLPLFQVGRRYHEIWHNAGLAGHIPAMGVEPSIVGGENDFGGMPRSLFEAANRGLYRDIVREIGLIHSRIVELVACRGHRVEVVELGWPGAAENLRDGLRKAAKYCGGG